MFTNKTNWIVFIVAIILVCSTVIAFVSIEDAKKENDLAQGKIVELNDSINSLKASLDRTNEDVNEQEKVIEWYQEIFSAWSKATPKVKDAIDRIMTDYGVVMENAHLFPTEKLNELEDGMMDAAYGAIRSTDPLSVSDDFADLILKASESRYDNVLKAKLDAIKTDGVTFPEDADAIAGAREYYDSFLNTPSVINSFIKAGLDKELEALEKLLDADEEKDLAKVFEDEVAQIKTPITLDTSFEGANAAWSALYSVLEATDVPAESTLKARALLDGYIIRQDQLEHAKEVADSIKQRVELLELAPDTDTRELISKIENEILAWIEDFEIDEANMHLICDLTPVKKEFEALVSELRALYDAYKRTVEGIGEVNVHSKASINLAFDAYDAISVFDDVDGILSLEHPNKVGDLYATLNEAAAAYGDIVFAITSIRDEIDWILANKDSVTQSQIDALDREIDLLLSKNVPLEALNTENVNYIDRLQQARLLPAKNGASDKINGSCEDYCALAKDCRELIGTLIEIKNAALDLIDGASSTDDIFALVEKALKDFANCFK